MKTRILQSVAAALLAAVVVASLPQAGGAMPTGRPSPKQEKQLAAIHWAGLRGNRALIPTMIQDMQRPTHSEFVYDSLMALSRLGATEALPVIDKVINKTAWTNPFDQITFDDIPPFARAARARLVAVDAAKDIADPKARAAAEVRRFYQEVGLTPDAINAALADPQRRDDFGLEAGALSFLTDMVYHDGPYRAFAVLPEVSHVNFAVYPGAAFHIRMAPLTHKQRIAVMVHDLSVPRDEDGTDAAEMRDLADEGPDAVKAILARLAYVKEHSDQGGPGSLLRVLRAAADPDKEDVDMITTY